MSDILYLWQIPPNALLPDALTVPTRERTAVIKADVFWRLGDYTRSCPTSPRHGRVYRKNLNWAPEHEDAWWLYVVLTDPTDAGYALHHPFRALLVDA